MWVYFVEKLVARRFRTACKKIDFSDRPTNRSRASVKGKTTPENLARMTVVEFFNKTGRTAPVDGGSVKLTG
jgi:hypothetical protein